MLHSIVASRKFALFFAILLGTSVSSYANSDNEANATSVSSHATLNFEGKDAIRILFTRIGFDANQLDLSDGEGPFSYQATSVSASYNMMGGKVAGTINDITVSPEDLLFLSWRRGNERIVRTYRYDMTGDLAKWVCFSQAATLLGSPASLSIRPTAAGASETFKVTFSPASVVSVTTGQRVSYTATNGTGAARGTVYMTIPLGRQIAALYVQGSISGVVQAAGVGSSVLTVAGIPTVYSSPKGTVPILVVYGN